MDQSWMKAPRISDEYKNGDEQLLEFAQQNVQALDRKFNCGNGRLYVLNDIRTYLIYEGIL